MKQPPKTKRLEVHPEDLAKVEAYRRKHDGVKVNITPEELYQAEIGMHYGYDAMLAVIENKMDRETSDKLLEAAQRVWNRRVVDISSAVYIATAAANSKKGKAIMNNGLKNFIKNSGADS